MMKLIQVETNIMQNIYQKIVLVPFLCLQYIVTVIIIIMRVPLQNSR